MRTGALASLGVEDGAVEDPGVNSLDKKNIFKDRYNYLQKKTFLEYSDDQKTLK